MAQDINDKVTRDIDFTKPVKPSKFPGAGYDVQEFSMHPAPADVDVTLQTVLAWPRKHDTATEKAFCEWLVGQLRALGGVPMTRALGCISVDVPIKEVGKPERRSTTLFAAHVDTCDSEVKAIDARKKINYDTAFGHIYLDKSNDVGSCLGADDGVGVWIMLCMISAGVPGSYIFTRGEECGRLGAEAMLKNAVDEAWLKTFDACIEFDRPRYDEIITHQSGGTRCASDKFGTALAKAINDTSAEFSYKISSRGVVTDNYSWRGVIAECVNVGVGYTNQHGPGEVLDYSHAFALKEAMLKIGFESLPVDRTPEIEVRPAYNGYGGYKGYWDDKDDGDFDNNWGKGHKWSSGTKAKVASGLPPAQKKADHKPAVKTAVPPVPTAINPEDEVMLSSPLDWMDYCESQPELAAGLLIELATELKAMRVKYDFVKAMLDKSLS